MNDPFAEDSYLVRRKVFTFLDSKFHVYDAHGQVVLFSRQKAFRLKEDIRIYSDESETRLRLLIRARQIIDFSAAYDVIDAESGVKVGALRRKGWSSLVRDSWEFLDASDTPLGTIREDSMMLAMVRRLLTNLVPQSFHAEAGGRPVATLSQAFNPFVFKLRVQLAPGARELVSPQLILSAGILLAAIEGRQG